MVDNGNGNGNGNPVAGGSSLNQKNVQQQQNVVQRNTDAAQLAWQIMANTNITMKTEVVKLPDFYGQLEKDTISASEFMARMDECQVTNEWNDITTFSYFRLALRGQADKWLSSIVRHLQLMAGQKTWTHIRPVFKAEFAAFWTTNSSLMVWQNWHTDLMKTHGCFSHIWRNWDTFSKKITHHTEWSRPNRPNSLKEAIPKMLWWRPLTTMSTILRI